MVFQTLSRKIPSLARSFSGKEEYVKDITMSFCRFCAKEKTNEELLNMDDDVETYNHYLKAIDLLKIDFLDLSETNKLPKKTCESCYNSFDDMYIFFEKFKKAQIYLQTLFFPIIKEEKNSLRTIKFENQSEDPTPLAELESSKKIETEHVKNKAQQSIEIKRPSDVVHQKAALLASDGSELNIDSDFSLSMPLAYCGIPIFQDDTETKKVTEVENEAKIQKEVDWIHSWEGYKWRCYHCKEQFNSMDEVRSHSKILHNMCYGFSCMDCDEIFNTFNAFIEHVRQHREFLRCYCQYCNVEFDCQSHCFDHIKTHWEGTQKICNLCGEILPDHVGMERHKELFKKVPLSRKISRRKPRIVDAGFLYANLPVSDHTVVKTWESYTWSCQECWQDFPNVATLRNHTQEVHNKCFSMKCMDCLNVMSNYKKFVEHVTQHRPCLQEYCRFCNAHIQDEDLMSQHIKDHISSPQKPCDGCGQIFENNEDLLKHKREFDAPRPKGTLTPEDVTCEHCNKYCYSLPRLRQHKKKHNYNRQRHFVCDMCGKAYLTQNALMEHVNRHNSNKSEICKICKMTFHSKRNLKAHVATHSDSRPFKCSECGKDFRTKKNLKYHLVSHSDFKAYACKDCDKTFKFITNLKVHQHQHTGMKPYACEVCEKTFSNWANCNKHMIRKHSITLARTKRTPQGRIAINRESGKPLKLASGKKVKEWMDTLLINTDKQSKKISS